MPLISAHSTAIDKPQVEIENSSHGCRKFVPANLTFLIKRGYQNTKVDRWVILSLSTIQRKYAKIVKETCMIETLQVANSIAGSKVQKGNQLADAFLSVNLSLLNASR